MRHIPASQPPRVPRRRGVVAGLALGLSLALAGCGPGEPPPGSPLAEVQASGELVVLTRNAPTTYYEGRDGLAGLEYEMAVAFADHLGVEARFKVLDGVEEILAALEAGEGHMAAAGLTRTEARGRRFRFGPSYQAVKQQVVCRRGGPRPDSIDALADVELQVVAGTSYEERLRGLKVDHPGLTWTATERLDTEQLLRRVWQRKLQCTVADSNIVALNRRYLPELQVTFDLTEAQPLAWAFPGDAEALAEASERWLDAFADRGALAQVRERYYGFVPVFDYVDVRTFKRRIRKRLPRYRDLFIQAAERHGLDWTLLAAQAYQESHWNPRAESPTGVRGIMMLTQRTARSLEVTNRLDARQSIFAGAKYLHRMRARLPEEATEPDRTWKALAAYNVGMGHLRDAEGLARELGKDPCEWRQLKTVLPLLAQKRYYRNLRYGYARGTEPVRYVQRIRNFRDILEQQLGMAQAPAGSPPDRLAHTPAPPAP